MKLCFSCKKELDIDTKPGRSDACPWCTADLKVCLNCKFFDQDSYNDCREPQAERVLDKDRSNFCDFFVFRDTDNADTENANEDPMKNLKDLFKDS